MAYGTIYDCSVTKENSDILLPYIIDDKSTEYKLNDNKFHSGIHLKCNSAVYAPCNCVVIQITQYDDMMSVTVQYSRSISIRYSHLDSVSVGIGDLIVVDTELGKCTSYVHLELLTTTPDEIEWVVRIGSSVVMYKNNPMQLFDGTIEFDHTIVEVETDEEEFEDSESEETEE